MDFENKNGNDNQMSSNYLRLFSNWNRTHLKEDFCGDYVSS